MEDHEPDLGAMARRLARAHPRLFHMTEAGQGEAIRARGLWSTSALLDRNGVTGEARAAIEASRRAACVRLPDGAVIRDNGVLREGLLAPLLPAGMAPRDWYRLLNAHVFFWPTDRGLGRLLGAGAYRAAEHDVLEFDALPLLLAHADRVRVTPMNTGATGTRPDPAGARTGRLPAARRLARGALRPLLGDPLRQAAPGAGGGRARRRPRRGPPPAVDHPPPSWRRAPGDLVALGTVG